MLASPDIDQLVPLQFDVLALRRIDDAPKLFRHLDGVKRETFAISSHTRFASTLDGDDSVSISVKTFHVPEGYEDFYRFCFDFLMEPSADVLSMNVSLSPACQE